MNLIVNEILDKLETIEDEIQNKDRRIMQMNVDILLNHYTNLLKVKEEIMGDDISLTILKAHPEILYKIEENEYLLTLEIRMREQRN